MPVLYLGIPSCPTHCFQIMAGETKHRTSYRYRKTSAGRMVQFNMFVHKGQADKKNITPPPPTPPPLKPDMPPKHWKHKYQKLQHKYCHSKSLLKKLVAELLTFKLTDATTKHMAELPSKRVVELSTITEKLVAEGHNKSAASKSTIKTLCKDVKALKQCVRWSIRGLACTVDWAKKKWSLCRLTEKEIYTACMQACTHPGG